MNRYQIQENGQKSTLPGSVLKPESADFLRRPDSKQNNRYQISENNESLRFRVQFWDLKAQTLLSVRIQNK